MSTIVVAKRDNIAVIAADSLSSIGTLSVPADYKVNHVKVFEVNQCYLATVGWTAMKDVIEDLILADNDLLDFTDRRSIFKSLLEIQSILTDHYLVSTTEDSDQPVESNQIDGLSISSKGIFGFSSYRNVCEYSKFWAMGSGRDYALGAMHSAYEQGLSAEEIAKAGIEAASVFDDASGLPVHIQSINMA